MYTRTYQIKKLKTTIKLNNFLLIRLFSHTIEALSSFFPYPRTDSSDRISHANLKFSLIFSVFSLDFFPALGIMKLAYKKADKLSPMSSLLDGTGFLKAL
ncbi:MAG: hypothetical protein IJT36_01115, partial [Alphaproteobacteria bacterium]|nr:hypothetical protein [Alphaproteobacteria bacterium]